MPIPYDANQWEWTHVATMAGQFNGHNAYRWLSWVLSPQRYVGKMLPLAFVAAQIPLLVLFVYTVFLSDVDPGITIDLLVVGLIATLAGTAIAIVGIWILLTPVASSFLALERYRGTGVRRPLPLNVRDERDACSPMSMARSKGPIPQSPSSKYWPPMTSSRVCTIGEREPGACSGTSIPSMETRLR